MDRRSFLKAGLGIGAIEILPLGSNTSLFSGSRTPATALVYPQSVGSGDPSANGIVLWTRLDPLATTSSTAVVTWQISTTPAFDTNNIVLQGVQTTSALADFTVKVILSNPALQPWTLYYYRFGCEGVLSNTGRFKTLPAPGANIPLLRLAYISCQDYTNGYYSALAALASESVDYVIHLGDYIYEGIGATGSIRIVPPFPSGSLFASTLDDYRHLYRTYRSDPFLQQVHENFAFLQIWDDHEFANDSYQDYHPDHNPNPTLPTPELRQAANQAWSEFTASSMPFDPRRGPLQSVQLYRAFRFGQLADLILTDQRLYRDGPPCGLNSQQRYLTSGCPERLNPSRTMLASTQKSWLIDRMHSSGTRWKLWGSELMMMSLKMINGIIDTYVTLDSWDGYPAERYSILRSLAEVGNVVGIAGDIHSFAAGYLKPSYDSIFQPRIGVEFAGGSVTSSNMAEMLIGPGESNSAPVPPKLFQQAFPGGLISLGVRLMNPEMEFFNSDTHGYVILDITAERLMCTMKNVSTIKQPQASVSTLASFVVPSGQKRIIRN
jgi:alkaline phosphatase D